MIPGILGAVDAAPRRVGRYEVVATLGAGAMGEVLRAKDGKLGREVAIKTVRNRFGMDPQLFHARFESEARALAALSHPAIVQVHDLGVDEKDEPFLIMELVDGPTLKGLLAERGPMSPHDARAMGIMLARGLEAAHARGILHRDVKPANILLARNGQWKLADFGVAHVPDSSQTITGQFLGTPAYAAPEAIALGRFSDKSDVFGLAAVLAEAITGKRLRGDASMTEIAAAAHESIALPAEVPPDLAAVLRPALSIDSTKRPSAARFAELLATTGDSTVSRTEIVAAPRKLDPKWVIAGVAGAIILIGLVAALSRGDGAASSSPARPSAAPARPERGREAPERFEPTVEPPRNSPPLDHKGLKEWNKIAEKANEGKIGEALDKLDKFEDRYGTSSESEQLRAYLAQFPRERRRDDD
jgi:serine/threonine protein kinase